MHRPTPARDGGLAPVSLADFDAGIEVDFDVGIEVDFDVDIEVDFDVVIGSSPELTDVDNRSEHTGSFLIQDVPGRRETYPSTQDRSCFKMFYVVDINVGSYY